jgi:hypothetical protein
MVLGGSAYSLDELEQVPPVRALPTGLPDLDALTGGGLAPGMVCGIAGPPRCGVTMLALRIAAAAAATRRALVVNDHVPTLLLRDHLQTLTAHQSAHHQPDTPGEKGCGVALASWLPLPDWREPEAGWEGTNYDLVVFDCYDDMIRPAAWPSSLDAVRAGRWLREQARRTDTTLVLTTRTPSITITRRPPPGPKWTGAGPTGTHSRADRDFAMRPVFDDICDVSIEIDDHHDTIERSSHDQGEGVVYRCHARGRGSTTVHPRSSLA